MNFNDFGHYWYAGRNQKSSMWDGFFSFDFEDDDYEQDERNASATIQIMDGGTARTSYEPVEFEVTDHDLMVASPEEMQLLKELQTHPEVQFLRQQFPTTTILRHKPKVPVITTLEGPNIEPDRAREEGPRGTVGVVPRKVQDAYSSHEAEQARVLGWG